MECILAYKKVMKSLFYVVNERKLEIVLSHNVVCTKGDSTQFVSCKVTQKKDFHFTVAHCASSSN